MPLTLWCWTSSLQNPETIHLCYQTNPVCGPVLGKHTHMAFCDYLLALRVLSRLLHVVVGGPWFPFDDPRIFYCTDSTIETYHMLLFTPPLKDLWVSFPSMKKTSLWPFTDTFLCGPLVPFLLVAHLYTSFTGMDAGPMWWLAQSY